MIKLFRPLLSVVLVAVLSSTAMAGSSAGKILAVGDSITAGEGVTEGYQGTQGYAARLQQFMRGWIGYAYQGNWKKMDLDNIAVPGYRTTDVLAQLGDPAMQYAIATGDVRIITLTVGGNDLRDALDAGSFNACFVPGYEVYCQQATQAVFADIGGRYGVIVGTLKALAPAADIVLIDQYNPLHKTGCDPMGIAATADQLLGAWNAMVVAPTAGALGATVVATQADFAAAGQFYLSFLEGDCLHPSKYGHIYLAFSVVDALLN